MFRATKNELFKIFTGKRIYVLTLVLVLLSLAMAYILKRLSLETTEMPIPLSVPAFPMQFLSLIGNMVLPILIIIMVSGFISDDYRDGTMKQTLLGAVTRSELLMSKIIAVIVSNLFMLSITYLAAYLFGTIFFNAAKAFIFNNIQLSASEGLVKSLMYYGIMLAVASSFGIVILTFSLLIKNSGIVVGLSVGIFFMQLFLQNFANRIKQFFIILYFSVGNAFMTPDFDKFLFSMIAICSIHVIIALIISFIYINKKDIVY